MIWGRVSGVAVTLMRASSRQTLDEVSSRRTAGDIDELLELLLYLLDYRLVAAHGYGHSRNTGIGGLADGQTLDIVAPSTEQSCHVAQDSRVVLDECRKDVTFHALPKEGDWTLPKAPVFLLIGTVT